MLRKLSLCTLALTVCMCTTDSGTETDNPLVVFEGSECKSGQGLTLPSAVMRTAAALTLEPELYDALHCFAWERLGSGAVQVDVLNYSAGCHVAWEPGEVVLEDDRLTLTVRNAACAVAGCGSCIYDFTFEVSDVDEARPLQLTFQEDTCHDIELAAELTLPLDERESGIVCREVRFYTGLEPICGTAHAPPCTGMDGPLTCATGACDDEALTCVARPEDADGDVCLETCEDHADCSLEIESCQGGLCRLRETF